jgi:hypothetical protein
MWPEDGISMTTPDTPVALARWTSSTMHREKAKIWGPRSSWTMSEIAASLRRHDRHASLYPVDTGGGKPLGDRDLVVSVEGDTGLLFPVPQGDVVKYNLGR